MSETVVIECHCRACVFNEERVIDCYSACSRKQITLDKKGTCASKLIVRCEDLGGHDWRRIHRDDYCSRCDRKRKVIKEKVEY